MGYLIHLCFYPHPIKPTRTRKTSKTSTRRKSHRIQRGKNFPGYVWMMIPPTNAPAVRRASPQGIGQRPVSLPEPPPSPVLQTAPQVAEPPFRQPPTLAEGATGYNPPDATTADIMRPKLQPPLLVSTTVGGEGDFGIKQRLHTPPESWRERHHYGCLLEKSSNLPCKRRTVIAIKLLELIATSLSHHRPGFPQVPNLRHPPSLPKLQRGPASTRGPEQGVEQQGPSTVSVLADSLPSCSCISRPQRRNSHRGCPEVGGACPTVKVNSM